MKYFILFILSLNLFAGSAYEIFEKKDKDGDYITYAKVFGINEPIELLIGVGVPEVLSLDTTPNKHIKLLRCYGGDVGTSTLVGYYYTYILDLKNKEVVGLIEFEDAYNNDISSQKPIWSFKESSAKVKYHDWNNDGYHKTEIFKVPKN